MDKYEISLWENFPDDINGVSILNERKLCMIGSDTMMTSARAIEPKMVTNVNGTNTFTFKMYHEYIDELTGYKYRNPFLSLLVNERKVKVLWKDKWYDLIIKSIDEDSDKRTITYTCNDIFITELSKNGYNLEFTGELQNNIGTAAELTQKVLEGSGWLFDEDGSARIIQKTEEPVYEVYTENTIEATLQSPNGDTTVTIPLGANILVFYSSVIDITSEELVDKNIQFLYSQTGYETDENEMLVINGNCYTAAFQVLKNNEYINFYQNGSLRFRINIETGVSLRYRANRLVKSQVTAYDDLLERYVNVYYDTEDNNKEVYGYQTSEYTDPMAIVNYVVNPSGFKSVEGWIGNDLTFGVYPKISNNTDITTYHGVSYLKVNSGTVYNRAFSSNKQYFEPTQNEIKQGNLGGLHIGDKYIFRIKFKADGDDPSTLPYLYNDDISPLITTVGQDFIPSGESYFSIDSQEANENWYEYTLSCTTSCPAAEIQNLGLFLQVNNASWIEEVELFKYAIGIKSYNEDEEPQRINPGEISLWGVEQTKYRYYNPNHNGVTEPTELTFIYESDTESDRFTPKYNNYEKLATIEESKSNRFNILQSIAETFQCWIRFTINHDVNGKILFNEDGTAQKYVTIVESVGEDLGWSFEYGIDLKSIKRKIVSNDLATKIIVEPNTNEFAENGFCAIARSNLNYSKENFVLNLDYYVNQGLLDKETLEKDLYSTSSDSIQYYYLLHQYNDEYDNITKELKQKQLELTKQQAQLTLTQERNRALQQQITTAKSDVMMLAGVTTWEAATQYVQTHDTNKKIQALLNTISLLETELAENTTQLNDLEESVNALTDFIDEQTERQLELVDLTSALHEQFFKKYSAFIQEGTWQEENYIDDNKYYLDAIQVAYTSSRPQLQYTIDVMRLAALEDFSSKVFNVGDICYIQDREFFGYCADRITPYKLKITISEITSFFDEPQKDTIKVQNYKTQFDDLFQRITATTQSLQYAEGSYNRAANAVTSEGTISSDLLQQTFDINQNLVLNASNQQVTWDSTGITVTDDSNTASKVKLMAGGLFITNDGGATWRSAVRGDGISTDILTAGRINTNEIYIYDGSAPSFRWDENGITAYSNSNNQINFNKFVRFDKYGIYGYDGSKDFVPVSENDIWDNGSFGLTWKGFFLKNNNGNTSFEISTDNDLIIKSGSTVRLQIGRLNIYGNNYGIKLRDNNNNEIFCVDDTGARIGGWTILPNGLIGPISQLSNNQVNFEDVILNSDGLSIPSADHIIIGGTGCQVQQTAIIPLGVPIKASYDAQNGTITFIANDSASAAQVNMVCLPIT